MQGVVINMTALKKVHREFELAGNRVAAWLIIGKHNQVRESRIFTFSGTYRDLHR